MHIKQQIAKLSNNISGYTNTCQTSFEGIAAIAALNHPV
jgi:hypothetical protein